MNFDGMTTIFRATNHFSWDDDDFSNLCDDIFPQRRTVFKTMIFLCDCFHDDIFRSLLRIFDCTRLPYVSTSTKCALRTGSFKVQRSQAIMLRSVFFRWHIPSYVYFLAIVGMATSVDVERELSTDLLETLAANGLWVWCWRSLTTQPDTAQD